MVKYWRREVIDLEIKVGDLIEKLDSVFKLYFSESMIKGCQRQMVALRNNKQDFDSLRAEHRESVNALIETIISLSEDPYHKSQTAIRHAPKEVQVLLFDRFLNAISSFSRYDPDEITDIPASFGNLLKLVLIESWENVFLRKHQNVQ